MGILSWIILGLIAGGLAKALHPGKDPGGVLVTMLLGIAGALLGGLAGSTLLGHGLSGFSLWSLLLAIGGAFLLLMLWGFAVSSRQRRRVA